MNQIEFLQGFCEKLPFHSIMFSCCFYLAYEKLVVLGNSFSYGRGEFQILVEIFALLLRSLKLCQSPISQVIAVTAWIFVLGPFESLSSNLLRNTTVHWTLPKILFHYLNHNFSTYIWFSADFIKCMYILV